MIIPIEFGILKVVQKPKFSLNWYIWFLGSNFPKNGIFGLKQKMWRPPLNIEISLVTKFQLTLRILMFWTKFARKGYCDLKTEKVNITIRHIHTQIKQNKYFNWKSKNFENITFLPTIHAIVIVWPKIRKLWMN